STCWCPSCSAGASSTRSTSTPRSAPTWACRPPDPYRRRSRATMTKDVMTPPTTASTATIEHSTGPVVVGIGGPPRPPPPPGRARRGVRPRPGRGGPGTRTTPARERHLPMYDPGGAPLSAAARHLIETVRTADAVVISTPGYHGG